MYCALAYLPKKLKKNKNKDQPNAKAKLAVETQKRENSYL